MKKSKLYAKKTLSVFLAVMMLMSAWVFVAPAEAEAIASNVRGVPAIKGSDYAGSTGAYNTPLFDGTLDRWFKFHNQNQDYVKISYPSKIYLDKSETLQSAGYFFNVDWHFGHSTDYRILIGANALGDNSQWSGKPNNYYTMTNMFNNYGFDASVPYGVSNAWVYGKDMNDGNSHNLRIVGYGHSTQGSDQFSYQDMTHTKYVLFKSQPNNDPNLATIYLMGTPKSTGTGTYSTSGSSFTAYGLQQNWTNKWVNNSNSMFHQKGYGQYDTSSSNHNPGGWPEMEWDIVIYDKSTLNSEINTANGYHNNDNRYTSDSWTAFQNALNNAKNTLKKRNVTQSDIDTAYTNLYNARTSTLTYNKYTVSWINHGGEVVHTETKSWNSTIDCVAISAGLKNTVVSISSSEHVPYVWNIANYVSNVTENITINEVSSGKPAPHNFPDVWTQNEANHSRICSVCEYEHIEAHKRADKGETIVSPTCTDPGEVAYGCSVCGKKAIETGTVPALGHSFTGDIAIVEGLDGYHYKKCERFDECGKYGWGVTPDEHEKHNWDFNNNGRLDAGDAVDTKLATCTSEGYEVYSCEVCKTTYTKILPVEDHAIKYTEAVVVDGICGAEGNKEFWSCSVCKKVWTNEECTTELENTTDSDSDGIPDELETTGPAHVYTDTYVVISSEEHAIKCENCDSITNKESHSLTDEVVTAPTCTEKGVRKYTCTVCGYSYTEDIAKAAHSMTLIPAVAAECEKAGNNAYYSCSTCHKFYKDEAGTTETTAEAEKISALTHKWSAHHDYDILVTPATCMSPAEYQSCCDYCKVPLVAYHKYGNPDTVNGHKFTGDEIQKNDNGTHSIKCVNGCGTYGAPVGCNYKVTADVASTCCEAGYTTYTCDCGNGYTTPKDFDYNNHSGQSTHFVGSQPATCYTYGSTGSEICDGCGTTISTKVNDLPLNPNNHENMQSFGEVESTCQTEGHKAYTQCICGVYGVKKVTIAKIPHVYTTYVSNGNGTHTATCETCDEKVAKPATDTKNCKGGTANCKDRKVCVECNAPYGEIDPNNHKKIEVIARVPSTCQTTGTTSYRKCTACNTEIDKPEEIAIIAHTYGAWTNIEGENKHTRSCTTCDETIAAVATQTEDCNGGTAYCNVLATCKDCRAKYGTYDAAKHSSTATTLKNAKPVSCQAPGYTGDYYYNCCDTLYKAGEVVAQLDHTYVVESRREATCLEAGEVIYKCSTCAEGDGLTVATKKEVLPLDETKHATTETVVVGKLSPTCEDNGYTGDIYYACCYDENATDAANKKALKEKGAVIRANGEHVFGEIIPEYMIEEITEENGVKKIVMKTEEPGYEEKIAARRADGKWYHMVQCSVCGVIEESPCYTYKHTYSCTDTDICEVCNGLCSLVDANKHDILVEIKKVEATHTTNGTKAYYKCHGCGKFFLDDGGKKEFDPTSEEGKALITISKETVPCTSWADTPFETKKPTCGENGYEKYACTVAGCTKVKTVILEATSTAHVWADDYKVIKEATCGSVGYKAIYCTVCGNIKPNSATTIVATGKHNFDKNKDGIVDRNDAVITEGENCQKPGTLTFTCTVCGIEDEQIDTEGVSAHNFGEWVTISGDCSSGIIQVRTCQSCNAKEQKTLTTDTHKLVIYVRVEPTPEKDGYVIYECENCKIKTEPEAIKYNGSGVTEEHLINEEQYKVVKEATCQNAEQRAYTCLRCGEKVIIGVGEKRDHYWLEQAAEVSTCDKAGHSSYYRCVFCREETGREDYEALGHEDADNNGKCDNCSHKFFDNGEQTCGCMCHNESWLMKIVYKIINFFWKIFKINPSCSCGAVHY